MTHDEIRKEAARRANEIACEAIDLRKAVYQLLELVPANGWGWGENIAASCVKTRQHLNSIIDEMENLTLEKLEAYPTPEEFL
jgi:aspartate ammonia-lyase